MTQHHAEATKRVWTALDPEVFQTRFRVQQLARVNPQSCMQILNDLARAGMVERGELVRSGKGGRPAFLWRRKEASA
jgi:predicted ArsR family transcriptional regulator